MWNLNCYFLYHYYKYYKIPKINYFWFRFYFGSNLPMIVIYNKFTHIIHAFAQFDGPNVCDIIKVLFLNVLEISIIFGVCVNVTIIYEFGVVWSVSFRILFSELITLKKLLLFAFVSYIYMGNRLGVINKSLLQINDSFINNHEYKTK